MQRFAASDLGLHCLRMSHKKNARLIWFKFRTFMKKISFSQVSKVEVLKKILLS